MIITIVYGSGSIEEINTTMMSLDAPCEGALLESNFFDITHVDEGMYLQRAYAPVDYIEDEGSKKTIDTNFNSRVCIVPQDELPYILSISVNGVKVLERAEVINTSDYECGLKNLIGTPPHKEIDED